MKQSLVDNVPAYVLGDLCPDEMRHMSRVLADSPALANEAALLQEALALHAVTLPAIAPSTASRQRLLTTLQGVDRFRPFLGRLCRMLDLDNQAIRRLLARIDDSHAWELGPVPGLYLWHFEPGLRAAKLEAGLVRVTAGQAIPRHRHLGPEVSLVLEGTLYQDGVRYFPGQSLECEAGTIHGLHAGSERDLVFVVTHGGIEIV